MRISSVRFSSSQAIFQGCIDFKVDFINGRYHAVAQLYRGVAPGLNGTIRIFLNGQLVDQLEREYARVPRGPQGEEIHRKHPLPGHQSFTPFALAFRNSLQNDAELQAILKRHYIPHLSSISIIPPRLKSKPLRA